MTQRGRGFTLVELAVGLFIIALLLGMLMVPLGTQFDQARYSEAQKHLDVAREAIIGFTLATGRLPCPATPTTATTMAGAGSENCALTEGVVPWAAIGVPEADPWGRRLTYRVTTTWADAPGAGLLSSFAMADVGTMTVTNGAVNIAEFVPAVIVSHGKNGLGAFLSDGTQLAGAAGDELQNANGNNIFVSRTHAPDFDDLVSWISPSVLKARMVAASRLP